MKKKTKRALRSRSEPDEIRGYIRQLYDHHQREWHRRLLAAAPEWSFLLALHLRLIELERMESAVEELLS